MPLRRKPRASVDAVRCIEQGNCQCGHEPFCTMWHGTKDLPTVNEYIQQARCSLKAADGPLTIVLMATTPNIQQKFPPTLPSCTKYVYIGPTEVPCTLLRCPNTSMCIIPQKCLCKPKYHLWHASLYIHYFNGNSNLHQVSAINLVLGCSLHQILNHAQFK